MSLAALVLVRCEESCLEDSAMDSIFGGLASLGVIVEKFVPQHQSNCEESKFASTLPTDGGVESFEPVDEH